ncbi:hypothetical protein [Sporosarcina sp. ANT_H38]|nr:hypothetical protein [Sporosarcina sp. ANT_H38]
MTHSDKTDKILLQSKPFRNDAFDLSEDTYEDESVVQAGMV